MDTWTDAQRMLIEQGQQLIKGKMPRTYAKIRAEASKDGRVWSLVRRGLAGEPNCFWATEDGQTVGAPFVGAVGLDWAVRQMAEFGCPYVCTLATMRGGGHGAH